MQPSLTMAQLISLNVADHREMKLKMGSRLSRFFLIGANQQATKLGVVRAFVRLVMEETMKDTKLMVLMPFENKH
jgi:hypothetical protein